MRALRFERAGSLAELKLQSVPLPTAQSGEVLVKIQAAAINPSDVKNVLGKMSQTVLPRTPGRDFAGVVIEGADDLLGMEVFGTGGGSGFTRDGTHAEYFVVPREAILQKPKQISPAQAAAMGVIYMTAWRAMIDAARVQANETVLILGVTGGVGGAAVRIAKRQGARIIGIVRRESDKAKIANLPVDDFIVLENQDLVSGVMKATNNRGADVVFDTIGGEMFEPCLRSLAHRGRQIAVASTNSPRVGFDLVDFYHREGRLFGVDTLKLSFAESAKILGEIVAGIEDGSFTPPPLETVSLEDAPNAYERINNGEARSKIVIVP